MANGGGMSNHVSVFHFTSRISSAKMRKYKIATERGMAATDAGRGSSSGSLPTPAPQVPPAGNFDSASSASPAVQDSPHAEPPSKKAKLNSTISESTPSTVGTLDAPGDSIRVAQKPLPELRIRYSDSMVLEDESLRVKWEDDDTDLPPGKLLQRVSAQPLYPYAPQRQTHPPPPLQATKQPTPPPPPPPPPAKNPDYGDFMSYYIMDADDEDRSKAEPKPEPKAEQAPPMPPKQQEKPSPRRRQPSQPHSVPRHHVYPPHPAQMNLQSFTYAHPGPPQRPAPALPRQLPPADSLAQQPAHKFPPQPRLPPPPQVHLVDIDYIGKVNNPQAPCTVAEMIEKLETLSKALSTFGGIPAPVPTHQGHVAKAVAKRKRFAVALHKKGRLRPRDVIDDLLGLMSSSDESKASEASEDDDDDDDDASNSAALNQAIENPGTKDDQLTYGIQFIQNALHSWATQRFQQQYMATQQEFAQTHMQPQQAKRGPGRPRKFNEDEIRQMNQPQQPQPTVIHINAANTPEGQAIKAFQEVLDSGSLQVNAVLPKDLIRALQTLYMQIDHLINQGTKKEPPWECMSYGAQIAAHNSRVERWKQAQQRAQQEMVRQQQLSHQHVMQQMGLPMAMHAQHVHALALDQQQGMHHSHSHHPPLHPLQPSTQTNGMMHGYVAVQPLTVTPHNGMLGQLHVAPHSGLVTPGGSRILPRPACAGAQQYGRGGDSKALASGPSSSNGPHRTFSFRSENGKTPNAFGSSTGSTTPSTSAAVPIPGSKTTNPGKAVRKTINSETRRASETKATKEPIETARQSGGTAAASGNVRTTKDTEMAEAGQTGAVEDEDTIVVKQEVRKPAPPPAPTFTAINASKRNILPSNGSTSNVALNFPHPGAVILDG